MHKSRENDFRHGFSNFDLLSEAESSIQAQGAHFEIKNKPDPTIGTYCSQALPLPALPLVKRQAPYQQISL